MDLAYGEELRSQIRALGLEAYAAVEGPQPHGRIPALLRACHLVLNLSQTGSLDKTVLEAMACGVPVLTSNDAFFEWLKGPAAGLCTLDTEDPHAIAARMLEVLGPGGKMLGRDLRRIVVQNHSSKQLVPRLVEILRGAATTTPAPPSGI